MHFVFDLNTIRSAWSGANPRGTPELHPAILFLQVANKGHRIVVTKEMDSRYVQLFDELKNASRQGPAALNIVHLYYTLKLMGKVDDSRCSADVPPLSEESRIKDEDKEFARLANLTRAVLVTYDEPLIRELTDIGVQAVLPEHAVILADP